MFNLSYDNLQWINSHPKEFAPPVWIFIYGWTAYTTSIQVNISRNDYAPITFISSMVWFRKCNSILSYFLSCSVSEFNRVERKATPVSISGCARLVVNKIFATMEKKSSPWFFFSIGESGLTLCIFLFSTDDSLMGA